MRFKVSYADPMNKAIFSLSLPSAVNSNAPPEWIHIFPLGKFLGRDGRGPYELLSKQAAGVISSSLDLAMPRGIPMDYDHQLEFAAKNGQPAPASGWITELKAQDDGIWGKVAWTKKAAAHVLAKEYRYVSPVFYHKDGKIVALESVALTNLPNFQHLKAIASKGRSMNIVTEFLGLPEDALAEAILEAIKAKLAEAATKAEEGKAEAKAEDKEIASQIAKPDPAKYVPKLAYDDLAKEVASLKQSQLLVRAEALVDKARQAGKITPALEAWAKDYACADAEGFKSWLQAAPDLRPGEGKELANKAPDISGLTEAEKAIAKACGLTETAYKKGKE